MAYLFPLLSLLSLSSVHAAPQASSACSEIPKNPAATQIGAQYLQVSGCGANLGPGQSDGGVVGAGSGTNTSSDTTSVSPSTISTTPSSPPSSAPTASSQSSSNATNSGPSPPAQSGGGKCPAGFRNTVFNTGAPRNAGWPQQTWNSLTANGVEDWVGFALDTLNKTSTYDTGSGAAATIQSLNAAQIHQVMDPTEVSAAVQLLKSNPPQYLTLFNEPDYSYQGQTPLTSPTDAATALKPLFAASHPNTTFLSPALANANSDWLPTFSNACNGCMSQIPIITMHLYNSDPTAAVGLIKQLHGTWPDKRIWITELAPGSDGGCTLDAGGIVSWMNTLVPEIVALGYVDKIFWNCGESSPLTACKTDLTNNDGSPTEILKAYGAVC